VPSLHAFIGNPDGFLAVVGHGVPLGRGVPISGYGLSYLITVGLSPRGICQQQSNSNGNQDPDHVGLLPF
jgi:hypothetical protein